MLARHLPRRLVEVGRALLRRGLSRVDMSLSISRTTGATTWNSKCLDTDFDVMSVNRIEI